MCSFLLTGMALFLLVRSIFNTRLLPGAKLLWQHAMEIDPKSRVAMCGYGNILGESRGGTQNYLGESRKWKNVLVLPCVTRSSCAGLQGNDHDTKKAVHIFMYFVNLATLS